jgi:hypothetical protein
MKWIKRHTARHSHPDIRAAGFWGTLAYDELCAIAGEFDLEDRVPANYARPEFIADRTMASQLPDGVERIREGLAKCVEVGLVALLEDGSYEVDWATFKGDTGADRKRRQRGKPVPAARPDAAGTVPRVSGDCPVTVPAESRDGPAEVPHPSRPRGEESRSEKRETSPLPPATAGEPAPLPPQGPASPPAEAVEPPPPAKPRPEQAPRELVPGGGRLNPAGLVALWNRVTGGRVPEPPEGKRLRRIKDRLRERPREADWLPAMEAARDVRAALGQRASWLTLDWLVKEPGQAQRLLDGEFDWKVAELGAPLPRRDSLRELREPRGGGESPADDEGEEPAPVDPGSVWGQALARLRARLPDDAMRRWLGRVHQVGLEDGRLTLGVPNPFVGDGIQEHYGAAVRRAVGEAAGRQLEVVFLAEAPAEPGMEALA